MKHEMSKERLEGIAADGFVAHGEIKAMARALLAAHEQEPVGWIYEDELPENYPYDAMFPYSKVDVVRMFPVFGPTAPSGTNQVGELVMLVKRLAHSLKKANPDSKLHLDAMDYLKRNALIGLTDVLRVSHPAPSIPTISFYRDGIAAAAKWVDAQREAYDNEHGRTDPDTGSFEFGNDAQLEYSATLADIAEGIRALHPNAASAPSMPAAVPEGYALVPVDATRAMIDAARRVEEDGYDAMHKAMIAAAPNGDVK